VLHDLGTRPGGRVSRARCHAWAPPVSVPPGGVPHLTDRVPIPTSISAGSTDPDGTRPEVAAAAQPRRHRLAAPQHQLTQNTPPRGGNGEVAANDGPEDPEPLQDEVSPHYPPCMMSCTAPAGATDTASDCAEVQRAFPPCTSAFRLGLRRPTTRRARLGRRVVGRHGGIARWPSGCWSSIVCTSANCATQTSHGT